MITSLLVVVVIAAIIFAVVIAEQNRFDRNIALFQVGVIIREYIGDELVCEGRILEVNGLDIVILDYTDFEKYGRNIVGLIRTYERTELVKDGQVIAIFGGTIE